MAAGGLKFGVSKFGVINPRPIVLMIYNVLLYCAGVITIKKEAKRRHRMLKIRKRKMKVHRRKRLWKRMW